MIYIGIDDTDNPDSRGTGRLARNIAGRLAQKYSLVGVTRHQLLFDSRIPLTSHNSSAAICLQNSFSDRELETLYQSLREWIIEDYQAGSDPGLCLAAGSVPASVTEFGRQAQQQIVDQGQARQLAAQAGLWLQGLGGTEDGIIGALAAVGLAACGDDGRYLMVGKIRDISGLVDVSQVLASGVSEVRTLNGERLSDGHILADKLRPARRGGRPIQYVEWGSGYWMPVKLD